MRFAQDSCPCATEPASPPPQNPGWTKCSATLAHVNGPNGGSLDKSRRIERRQGRIGQNEQKKPPVAFRSSPCRLATYVVKSVSRIAISCARSAVSVWSCCSILSIPCITVVWSRPPNVCRYPPATRSSPPAADTSPPAGATTISFDRTSPAQRDEHDLEVRRHRVDDVIRRTSLPADCPIAARRSPPSPSCNRRRPPRDLGVGDDLVECALQLADIRLIPLRHILDDIVRQHRTELLRLRPQNRRPHFVVRRLHVGDQTTFEPRAQPILQLRDRLRRPVAGDAPPASRSGGAR